MQRITCLFVAVVAMVALTSALDHQVVDNGCACFEKGNYYIPNLSDGCRSFYQDTLVPNPTRHMLNCPDNTIFDYRLCTCEHAPRAFCPTEEFCFPSK